MIYLIAKSEKSPENNLARQLDTGIIIEIIVVSYSLLSDTNTKPMLSI